jgi:hypothetical protein
MILDRKKSLELLKEMKKNNNRKLNKKELELVKELEKNRWGSPENTIKKHELNKELRKKKAIKNE